MPKSSKPTTSAEAERIRRAAAAVVGIRQRELFEQPSLLMLQETGSFQPFLTWARSTRQCIQRSPSNAVLRSEAREPGPAAQPSASAPSRARRSCDMCGAQVNRAHIPPAPPSGPPTGPHTAGGVRPSRDFANGWTIRPKRVQELAAALADREEQRLPPLLV